MTRHHGIKWMVLAAGLSVVFATTGCQPRRMGADRVFPAALPEYRGLTFSTGLNTNPGPRAKAECFK